MNNYTTAWNKRLPGKLSQFYCLFIIIFTIIIIIINSALRSSTFYSTKLAVTNYQLPMIIHMQFVILTFHAKKKITHAFRDSYLGEMVDRYDNTLRFVLKVKNWKVVQCWLCVRLGAVQTGHLAIRCSSICFTVISVIC